MSKKIFIGLLLMATMLLCACNAKTEPREEPVDGIPLDGYTNTYTAEEEEIFALIEGNWVCENSVSNMNFYVADTSADYLYFPGFLYRADLGILLNDPIFDLTYGFDNSSEITAPNETAITITSIDDKDLFVGHLLVANDGSYIKYQLSDVTDNWYYFYPEGSEVTAPSDFAIEQMELFELVQGKWICETDAAYIDIYLPEDAEYDWDYDITIESNWSVHDGGYFVNDFAIFESGVPHFANPPEGGILESETAVYFTSRDGEFETGGLLIVDNNRQYIKFELEYGTWYTFYPYDKETDLLEYIYSQLHATYFLDEAGIDTLEEDSLRETFIFLNNSFNIDHFYKIEATPLEGGNYYYKINAEYLDIWGDEWTITFYIDAKGNLIRQDDIKEEQIR